jgi:hypothetical protein
MRRVKKQSKTSSKHITPKHSKLAYAGFIIALAISFIALYYIWTHTAGFGKSIQGLQNYACVQYLKENPGEKTCPSFTAIETQKDFCCCYNPNSQSKFGGKMEIYVAIGDNAELSCSLECKNNGRELDNVGRCKWI